MSNPGTTNLQGWWELDETSGTRVDQTANGNDLSDINSVTNTTGVDGNAARFDNTSSQYLKITDASQTGLDITGDFTMSMFCRLPNGNTGQQAFMSKLNSTGNQRSYFLYKETVNDVRMLMSSNGSYQSAGNPLRSYTYPTNTWFHLGFVYDASAGTGKFYINGSQLGTTVTGMPTSVYNGSADFCIGGAHGGIYTSEDIDIDLAGIWSQALTDAEMSWLYNSGSGRNYTDISGGGGGSTFVPKIAWLT